LVLLLEVIISFLAHSTNPRAIQTNTRNKSARNFHKVYRHAQNARRPDERGELRKEARTTAGGIEQHSLL
jgi:hypothetical protein